MSKASELIEQLSQYVDSPSSPNAPKTDKSPGDEVEELETNVMEESREDFNELLNSFCNKYDPNNTMTIKECIDLAYEDNPRKVDNLINALSMLEYKA